MYVIYFLFPCLFTRLFMPFHNVVRGILMWRQFMEGSSEWMLVKLPNGHNGPSLTYNTQCRICFNQEAVKCVFWPFSLFVLAWSSAWLLNVSQIFLIQAFCKLFMRHLNICKWDFTPPWYLWQRLCSVETAGLARKHAAWKFRTEVSHLQLPPTELIN